MSPTNTAVVKPKPERGIEVRKSVVAASTQHPNSVFPFIYPTLKTQTCDSMRFGI
jgi:hypothetical protein